ncbi:NAD(P)-binding protein [Exidia glandulosa HHB12029]|uniref:NAD(P)-binding protein n=1 Tax=Exidia glandulosa HHB12029 TaxID=1314781 RepID=A0A165M9X7_EXIGL|nr:NAD(P)-binding protein [Exidia glandulosa HHB12029]
MKIAVTGASGNLGQRVTRIAISHGHRVVGIDKVPPATPPQVPEEATSKEEWFRYVELDIRNYDQVLEAFRGCDAVIHLAAIPNPGDYVVDTHNLNVVSSWNALRAAAELGIERICQASSINAVGLVWGDNPIIDYLPMDENHPCRPEDPYSLSKLMCELQAATIVRRWPNIRIASIRLAWAVPNREYAMGREMDWVRKELWAWVDADESARAFVLGVTSGDFKGHEPFFIIAPTTCQEELTADLVAEHWPNAEIRKEFHGIESLYDCSKAERLLGWVHAGSAVAPAVSVAAAVEPEAVPAPVTLPVSDVAVADSDDVVAPSTEAVVPAVVVSSELDAEVEASAEPEVEAEEAVELVVEVSAVEVSSPATVLEPLEPELSTPVAALAVTEPAADAQHPLDDPVEDSPLHSQQPLESESSSSSSDTTSADGDLDAESALSSDTTEPSESEVELPSEDKPIAASVCPPVFSLEPATADDLPSEHHAPPASPLVEPVAP